MRRLFVMGATLALLTLVINTAVVHGQQMPPYSTVKDMASWEASHSGGKGGKGGWQSIPNGAADGINSVNALETTGSYWSNGPFDAINGLASWNGQPNVNFWARTADDFVIGVPSGVQNTPFTLCLQPQISEIRTTQVGLGDSPMELEIWSTDASGAGPTNARTEAQGGDILPMDSKYSTVFNNLGTAFGRTVEEFIFPFSPPLSLASGRFWVNPLGFGTNSYFATSQGGRDGAATGAGYFRGAIFGFSSWVLATTQVAPPGQFAFDIDAACALPFRVRILGTFAAAAASKAPDRASPNTVKTLEFTVQNALLGNQPDLAGYEFSSGFTTLGATVLGCTSSIGTCTVNGNMVTADYALPAAGSAVINVTYEAGPSSPDLQTCVVTGTSLPRTSQCVNAHTLAFTN